MDPEPRPLSPQQADLLVVLSRFVATHLERERELAARRALEAELRVRDRAVDAAASGVLISDPQQPDAPAIYVNPAFERLSGYPADEVLGRNCRFLQGPATDPAAVATLHAAIAGGQECRVTLLNYRRDGTPFWNELSIAPVRDPAGEVTHFIGVQLDVTAERELARLKDEMVAVVSHDLRTPLTSIVGYADLLLSRQFPEAERRRFLTTIAEEGRRLGGFVDEFLDLRRMEEGGQGLTRAPRDPAGLLERALSALDPDPAHPTVLEVPNGLPPVDADGGAVQRVLTNLVGNARKYSPAGGEVRVTAAGTGAGMLLVTVADRGLGLPPEALPRLFDPFYRVDAADRREIRGTGLGLAICKQLVELHGGRIWAESDGPGRGARFSFTLPFAATPDRARDDGHDDGNAAG